MNIFAYFKRHGIDVPDASIYSDISLWESWYKADVRSFHRYKVYQGGGNYAKCKRKSLGMAKKLCEDIADMLYNERCKISMPSASTQAYVESVLQEAGFDVLCNEYQERKAACGTVAYVPYLTDMVVDEEGRILGGKVALDYVTAKDIYPVSWSNGRITEVVFTFAKVYKGKKYMHFQHHKLEGGQYVILNSVAECTGSGRDLTPDEWDRIPAFWGLAARVETGSDKPQFVIDRLNMANNVSSDESSPMGISIYANSLDVLAKLDLEYDSYANEFVLGRKRIFVSPETLSAADGSMVFDPNDTVFYTLPEDYFQASHEAIREVNMALRVNEHEQAINNDLNLLSLKCGFGTQYYRFERGAVATATQVISENSDMYRTICKHELVLEQVLKDLICIIVRLGIAAAVPGLTEISPKDVTITFDDSIIVDKQTERAEDRNDVAMGVMSLAEYRAKWYGETEEEAAKRLPDQSDGVLM